MGDWNATCDICGFKYKASRLKKRWDGFMCCPKDWNPRQPQDFVRGRADPQAPPWTRPDPGNSFVTSTYRLLQENGFSILQEADLLGNKYNILRT